jgi:hypothetical protein
LGEIGRNVEMGDNRPTDDPRYRAEHNARGHMREDAVGDDAADDVELLRLAVDRYEADGPFAYPKLEPARKRDY